MNETGALGSELASKCKILVVDDDLDILSNLKFILKNYSVETFTNPALALTRLDEAFFDIIICDYQMPEMNGVELLSKSLEKCSKAKRILMTGFTELIKNEALWNKARVHRILAKPFLSEEVLELVENTALEIFIEQENEQLRKLALTDSLTGAANQRYFWDRLKAEFSRAQRFQRPLSLVIFDIDTFKGVNDSKGHLEGDRILKTVAEILIKETRQMDVVARYGGDEFAIILPEIDATGAQQVAVRLRDKIQKESGISLSGGIGSIPPAQTERDLVAMADSLLLKVKQTQKGRVLA